MPRLLPLAKILILTLSYPLCTLQTPTPLDLAAINLYPATGCSPASSSLEQAVNTLCTPVRAGSVSLKWSDGTVNLCKAFDCHSTAYRVEAGRCYDLENREWYVQAY
ncbi:hypothetical protein BU16DRAFT_612365 [Lophium mytilinum]|uniref:Cyanovirin-N domain-containing protein n=1 Tax=Lophium mytilinum TaxID=390894 RepID=A0A6A6RGC4_9PEZI|nr:hypothetical protein BU16DRAFT_612365 [Lophium mytilinum]